LFWQLNTALLAEYVGFERNPSCLVFANTYLAKIVDVLTFKTKYNFDVGIRKIEDSYQILKDLTQVASHAMLKDTHELLKDQSAVLDYVAEQSFSMVSNLSALNQAINNLQTNYSSKLWRLHEFALWLLTRSTCRDTLSTNQKLGRRTHWSNTS
jgi:hypothetical protein